MNRLRDNLFPGPALTVNQYANVRLRHHPGLFQQTQHQRTAGYDSLTPALIRRRRTVFQRIIDGFIQRIFVHRFGQETKHALLGGRHRIGNRAVSGKDNHRHPRMNFLDFAEQLQAVHLIHA